MQRRTTWVATMAALGVFGLSPAFAQSTRPDAGTILETPRQIPTLPEPGGPPAVVVPPAPAAATFDRSVTLTPAAFRVQGNTLVDEAQLQQVLAPFVGKRTDMAGLLQAAAAVRQYYRERGYILTEAYLPQQQFAATGGTVTIHVLEARVGKASVRIEGSGLSQALVEDIVRTQLPPGTPITEALLEKPVLLLRDLAGFDAVADVQPGAQPVKPTSSSPPSRAARATPLLLGADNYGTRSAGDARAYVDAEALNLAGRGDVLGARVQLTEQGSTTPCSASATAPRWAAMPPDWGAGRAHGIRAGRAVRRARCGRPRRGSEPQRHAALRPHPAAQRLRRVRAGAQGPHRPHDHARQQGGPPGRCGAPERARQLRRQRGRQLLQQLCREPHAWPAEARLGGQGAGPGQRSASTRPAPSRS